MPVYQSGARVSAPRNAPFLVLLLLASVSSGCGILANQGTPDDVHENATPAEPAGVTATNIPAAGTDIAIRDPGTDREIQVTLGPHYIAASSRVCSKYYDLGTYDAGAKPRGIACRNDDGRWVRIPVHVQNGFAE